MRRLVLFNFVTLNGFYKGPGEDTSWHVHGAEENDFAANNLKSDPILLMGRVTYEMMASFWPTPMAIESDPKVAGGMNKSEKIVFSHTLKKATWNNTRILKENIVEEIRKMKGLPGKDMAILGSGSIATLFAEHGLIDEYQIMVDPIIIGRGTPIFDNIKQLVNLTLIRTQPFKSGTVLLCYKQTHPEE